MAWMPVAEAAARLGVSERTIWRRIKSENIPSRSEHGRTLVDLDEASAIREGAPTFLQRADMSLRASDDETVSTLFAELAEYRATTARETARARRTARFAGALAAVLAIALAAGLWHHANALTQLREANATDRADLEAGHAQSLADAAAEAARADTAAAARAGELARLQKVIGDHRDQVDALAASNDAALCIVDERLSEFGAGLAWWSNEVPGWDAERAQLAATIEELREMVRHKEHAMFATQQQSERIIAALRRHAARNAGLAEGLQLHLGLQQRALARLQTELDELRTVLASTPGLERTLGELAMRDQLRKSILHEPSARFDMGGPSAPPDMADHPVCLSGALDRIRQGLSRLRAWLANWPTMPDAADSDDALARVD
jgi:hypothetical protein